jgi:type 1 glutamine amidotransferase
MLAIPKFTTILLLLTAAGCVAPLCAEDGKVSRPVRVMVVTGGHPYDTSFGSLFEGYEQIVARVHPRDVAFKADFRSTIDVLVLYDLTQEITESEKSHVREFLESGKGMVVLHHAVADYWKTWPWYQSVTGATYYLKAEADRPASKPTTGQILVARPACDNPITADVGPLTWEEETYKGMTISRDVKVLLETDNPTSDKQLAWIGPYTKSRVVVITPGHDRKSHSHPGYRRLVRNAILWSAGYLR